MDMTTPFDLSGQTAIVTGANPGSGQAIALSLAAAGADIAAVGRTPAQETVEKVRALGRQAQIVSADLSSIEPVQRVVDETLEKLGRLDILVNNAGIIRRADSVDFTEEDWDAVIDTNLKTTFFLCQAAGRHMLAQGAGKIINIASLLSFQGGIRVPSYTASKSGVAGLTKLLANEWAARGVNVNAIAPGPFDSNMMAFALNDPNSRAAIASGVPMGRIGMPDDMAGVAIYLASAAGAYVTGAVVPVGGGLSTITE